MRLASVNSRTEMLSKIASVLGAQLLPGDDAISSICNQIDSHKRLLILDNFEHLLAASDAVSSLLEQAPNLSVLITSRQRLQLTEEAVCPVLGLGHHGSKGVQANHETSDDSSKLFVDVAKRTRIDFDLHESNAAAIHRIVSLVKGHPLAIVLAASWVDGLSCDQIERELESGLGILATETSDVPERQRSVRATFNYSWTLLEDDEQRLFSALSVFRGGFDVQAAQQVTGASVVKLTRLVRKSMLQYFADNERYEMHELLRQYAEVQLDASGRVAEVARVHSNHYLTLLNSLSSSLFRGNASYQQRYFSSDFNNFSKAWHFALFDKHSEVLVQAIIGLRVMCSAGAHSHDLLELLQPALPLIKNPKDDVIQRELALNLLLAMGFAYRYTNGYFAKELGDIFERAYALSDGLSTSSELFVVLYGKWSYNFTTGNLSSNVSILDQWRQRLSSLGDDKRLLPYAQDAEFVLHMLEGPQWQVMGELSKARATLQAGLELEDPTRYFAMMGNYGLNFAVSGRHWLAINLCVAGQLDQSEKSIAQAHEIAEQANNPYLRMFVAFGQLIIATVRRDVVQIELYASAVKLLVSTHRIFQAFEHHAQIYSAYAHLCNDSSTGIERLQSLIDSGKGIPVFCLFDVQLFADAQVRACKPKTAIKYLQTYTEPARERKIKFSLAESSRIEGDAHLAMGDHLKARQCYKKALTISEKQKAGLYSLRAGLAFSKLLFGLNQHQEAKRVLLPVLEAYPQCHHTADYREAVILLEPPSGNGVVTDN